MLSEREQKGLQIAALAKIEKNRLGWKVPSQSGNGTYVVNLDGGQPLCTCPDFEKRHMRCKHIHAVEYVIQRETKADGTETYTESVKVTYTQEWPAYNQAQRDEKREFMRLLSDLCQIVPQPPQAKGRPRLPLSEMLFAAAMKVYSTESGRRFMGDLETAADKGYISRLPHYNSVFNYLENADLTPVLRQLIEVSSLPMRSVETDFAVDSSGFGTSRFVRWYTKKYGREQDNREWVKLNMICGVQTNIVTSVEVSGWATNDAPFFAPLVKSTAKRFQMEEVSADKGYVSHKNMEVASQCGATPFIPFKSNAIIPTDNSVWAKMYHWFMFNRQSFLEHYHKRSNAETVFSMIKGKFGDSVRSKTDKAQVNEVLLKVLCHNICVLIQAMYRIGLEPTFWAENPVAQKVS